LDGHPWWFLLEWTVKAAIWSAAVANRRAVTEAPYSAAVRALRHLPGGGEAGGTTPDGVTWYVRVSAAGQDDSGDRH
jgi:hypothetical protein